MFLNLQTFNVKTHREVFLNKWTMCLFYSSNEDFGQLQYWTSIATQRPITS